MAHGQAISFEYLGDDAVYNIIKRLTVQNLCKMSTLSSTWKDMINDANLINLHRAWSKENPLLLIVSQPSVQNNITSNDSEEVNPVLLTSVDPTDGAVTYQVRTNIYRAVEVISNGRGCLFCILCLEDFIIFNATTKEIQTLPTAGLIDPPIPSVIAAGFGYIESRHVYAVIKLFSRASRSCQILLLSETGEIMTPWRRIVQKYSHLVVPDGNGIMVRNKCYWKNRNVLLAKFYRISPSKVSMLCLDIESEMFHEVYYPKFIILSLYGETKPK